MVQASQSGTSVILGRKIHLKYLVLRVTLDANVSGMAFRYLQDYRLCHLCRLYVPCVVSQDRSNPRKVVRSIALRKTRRPAPIFFPPLRLRLEFRVGARLATRPTARAEILDRTHAGQRSCDRPDGGNGAASSALI